MTESFASSTALPAVAAPVPNLTTNIPGPTRQQAVDNHANGQANGNAFRIARVDTLPPQISNILPSGSHPLSGISLRANLLGIALGLCVSLAVGLAYNANPFWRTPFFISTLALFHFLEFYITALYNTPLAKINAFLLSSNGSAYTAAHTAALLETLISQYFNLYGRLVPEWSTRYMIITGFGMMLVGQLVRSVAMAHAGTNFNHTVQWRKIVGHQLVTSGIYGWLRHPSYFGYFWWAVGTQVATGNLVCLVTFTLLLWKFFQMRIRTEEQYLIKFFGDDYVLYRKTTGVGIPFIS